MPKKPKKTKLPYKQREQQLESVLKRLGNSLSRELNIPVSKPYLRVNNSRVKCFFVLSCSEISDSQKTTINNILKRQWEPIDMKYVIEHIVHDIDPRKKSCIRISIDQSKV